MVVVANYPNNLHLEVHTVAQASQGANTVTGLTIPVEKGGSIIDWSTKVNSTSTTADVLVRIGCILLNGSSQRLEVGEIIDTDLGMICRRFNGDQGSRSFGLQISMLFRKPRGN